MKRGATDFPETSVLMRTTQHHIPEDGTLYKQMYSNYGSMHARVILIKE
jgi:hypothetical protein